MKRNEKISRRQAIFCKRRAELVKRARDSELSIMCDAQVALILFSASGTLFKHAGSRMQEIIQAYFNTHEDIKPSKPSDCSLSHDHQHELKRSKEELQRLERHERGKSADMEDLDLLSLMELDQLEAEMLSALKSVRQIKDLLIAKKLEDFARKEQEMLKENERLKNELEKAMRGIEEKATSPCKSCKD